VQALFTCMLSSFTGSRLSYPFGQLMRRIYTASIISILAVTASCQTTTPVAIEQTISQTPRLKQRLYLHLIDAVLLPKSDWLIESERLKIQRENNDSCKLANNEAVYKALISLNQPAQHKVLSTEVMPLFEAATRLCNQPIVDENYRTLFAITGSHQIQIQ